MENKAEFLFDKLIKNKCSADEAKQIVDLLANDKENSVNEDLILAQLARHVGKEEFSVELLDRLDLVLQCIPLTNTPVIPIKRVFRTSWKQLFPYVAAAVLFLAISGGLIFYFTGTQHSSIFLVNSRGKDIAPGGNKAVLTLANGSKIVLDNTANGKIAQQAGITITKTQNGQLLYTVSNPQLKVAETTIAYNTIQTPRGGEYQVELPDGTHVWLNAASSLRYPTQFAGNERRVELHGEGYFEVAKNKAMPFRVESTRQEVEVLGTHFNINAYDDDRVSKTTLLEGSVRLNRETVLKPGEQSAIGGAGIRVSEVNTDYAIAWKNGKFEFENENIKELMRKIARWYDVEVIYDGEMTHQDFSGSVSRFDQISKILNILESTNTVHFKIEGRRITVMP